jgi:hypothetical protein
MQSAVDHNVALLAGGGEHGTAEARRLRLGCLRTRGAGEDRNPEKQAKPGARAHRPGAVLNKR